MKLKLLESKKGLRQGTDLEWLESLGTFEVSNAFGQSRASLAVGGFDDLYLRISAKGGTVGKATAALADRVEKLIREGKVVFE